MIMFLPHRTLQQPLELTRAFGTPEIVGRKIYDMIFFLGGGGACGRGREAHAHATSAH
jgi:hypothetical protein